MGQAPAVIADDLRNGNRFPVSNGLDLKSKANETTTVIGDKTYLIAGSHESIEVEIYNKSTGKWMIPTVLGKQPKPCKDHSAVAINEDRILVIKKGAPSDDCIWFLEVDTQYVMEQKKTVGTEIVAWSKGLIGNAPKPAVISGPSGVGKGTLISLLMEEFPSLFGFSVSHTTRAPREMEKNGVHYHFTERSVMEKEIKDGKFLEHASVHGNLYGTSIEAVEVVADAGKRCILDIDVQGARSVRSSPLEAIFIFVCPPSMGELEKRLRARRTETEEQIQKRLRNAEAEIKEGTSSGIFDHILKNDKLDECYKELKKQLGLDGIMASNNQTAPRGIDLPMDHSVSNVDKKIYINCRTPGFGKASKNLIVLDVSSLKGGAPGWTRGLDVHITNSFSDGFNVFL